jgi:hypothetical protein
MQDIGQGLSRIRLTGLLVIALVMSACSSGSASNSTTGSTTGTSSTSTASGTTVSAAGTATLTWVAPTENANGTPITDLAGYTVYYGTNPSDLTQSVEVSGGTSTSAAVANLPAGTYYFAVAAYNSLGVQSEPSNVASITT